jgi:flagellar biosynthesis protein FlhF
MELRNSSVINPPLIKIDQNTSHANYSGYVNPAQSMNAFKDSYQSSGRAPVLDNLVKQQNTNDSFLDLKGEVNSLSERLKLLSKKLNEHSYTSESRESPEFADSAYESIYRTLVNSEMSQDYAKRLVNEYLNSKREGTFLHWFANKVNIASTDPIQAVGGRRIAFIGPTGAGKTTTIAKLASIFSLWEHKKVLLLTSDTFKIAAFEQLKTYAIILGIPADKISDPDRINEVLGKYENTDIILLDTAGRNQKDARHTEAFSSLFNAFKPDAIHLVLAANMKHKDMFDVIEKVLPLNVSHLVITKLDETTSYGSILDVSERLGKPFSFFTTGQDVPTDIEVASGDYLCKMIFDTKDADKEYE